MSSKGVYHTIPIVYIQVTMMVTGYDLESLSATYILLKQYESY